VKLELYCDSKTDTKIYTGFYSNEFIRIDTFSYTICAAINYKTIKSCYGRLETFELVHRSIGLRHHRSTVIIQPSLNI
jgi:hypothetical protein